MPALIFILVSLFCISTNCYSQSGFIMGKVYSQSSKTPLQEAKLILKKNNKYFRKAKTDYVGNYWFGELKAGYYSVWILKEGYCQLEMGRIELFKNGSIQLDLGLMENARNSNVARSSKIYMLYQHPIHINLETASSSYQGYADEINILNEVYEGNEIRIAPKSKPSPIENSRATHYNEHLKALEKASSFTGF